MKKFLVVLLATGALTACEKKQENVLVCGNYEVQTNFSEDRQQIQAVINGDNVELNIAVSGSGARYVGVLNDTEVELWNKGQDWTLFLADEAIECK